MDLHLDNIAVRAIRRLLYRMENPAEPLVRIGVAPSLVLPHEVLSQEPAGEFETTSPGDDTDEGP